MNIKLILLINLLILNTSIVFGYGESSSGHPNWQEREAHMILNSVRIANYFPFTLPSNVMSNEKYPAVDPVYYDDKMNKLSKLHSDDMAMNGCFQHDSCNGTGIMQRVFANLDPKCLRAFAENIAAGYSSGLDIINYWICEKTLTGKECYPDGTKDGHRVALMSSKYNTVGTSRVVNDTSRFKTYWTQDFELNGCNKVPPSPIPSGSHTFVNNKLRYLAAWSSTAAPTSVKIHLNQRLLSDEKQYQLSLHLGSASKGIYMYEPDTYNECQSYFFTFTTADGTTYRYPTSGFLKTVTSATSKCDAWTSDLSLILSLSL
ncbi:hypothetical protein PPL_02810 [Heterostelium album PN500]|uniref:SCP domain-containing protein n=1 Tax=Heterostelium pallidum (strain ATCC 26659 / Pp 5 / PN500) TaxID=670386 RepID=D3B345_HETP5|nr:hypothetical protein PPL_02810 [Heterostelium album PN500]EFA83743.1 hypothetical protein PPL_02810 [Heterostelium album PN500]|eukprot:XP_020435860.1 hypothetical protein PPL_02810 [Heterostelium album PN500]